MIECGSSEKISTDRLIGCIRYIESICCNAICMTTRTSHWTTLSSPHPMPILGDQENTTVGARDSERRDKVQPEANFATVSSNRRCQDANSKDLHRAASAAAGRNSAARLTCEAAVSSHSCDRASSSSRPVSTAFRGVYTGSSAEGQSAHLLAFKEWSYNSKT
jgi:hypothetical protein